jgi:hypothetical protein
LMVPEAPVTVTAPSNGALAEPTPLDGITLRLKEFHALMLMFVPEGNCVGMLNCCAVPCVIVSRVDCGTTGVKAIIKSPEKIRFEKLTKK